MGQAGVAAFTVGGNIIGSYFGGPIGSAIGGMAGGLIGSLLFNRTKKPLLPDVQLMNSAYGNPIPMLWGTGLLPGTVIWMTDITQVSGGGAKGGKSGANAAHLYMNVGIAFLDVTIPSEIPKLVKLYLDGKIYQDNSSGNSIITPTGGSQFAFNLKEYDGREDQLPDPDYVAWCATHVHPLGAVPAYRGLAHLVFHTIDVQRYGGRLPQVSAIWSNAFVVGIGISQFLRLATDGSNAGQNAQPTPFGSVVVDWTRNRAFSLSSDGTLRSYSLATKSAITVATLPQIYAITGGDNTALYGWSTDVVGPDHILTLNTIDPVSLSILNSAHVILNGLPVTNLSPGPSLAFSVVAPTGNTDVVAGVFLGSEAFFIDPVSGGAAIAPLQFTDFFSQAYVALGARDVVSGNQDVWFLQWDAFDSNAELFLYGAQYQTSIGTGLFGSNGATISVTLVHTFNPADVGDTPSGGGPGGTMVFDASDNTLIISVTGWSGAVQSFKFSPSTNGIIWTSAAGGTAANFSPAGSGTVAGITGSGVVSINTSDGTVTTQTYPVGFPAPSISNSQIYIGANKTIIFMAGPDLYALHIDQVDTGLYPVAQILTDICVIAGLEASDIDVSLITKGINGYAIRDHRSTGAAIADICHTYSIDMIESDYKLKFVPRGQPVVATILQADLVSHDHNDQSKYWVPRRTQELELPLEINVKFSDPALDYQPGGASARRNALPGAKTVFSKRRLSLDLPVMAVNVEARQIAENLLYTMWAERQLYDSGVGQKYLWVDGADNVVVTLDNGFSYQVRTQVQEISPAFSSLMVFCGEDRTTYQPSTSPGASVSFPIQTVNPAPQGQLLQFNVPLLQDGDAFPTASRIYFGAGSNATPWLGGGLYKSPDDNTFNLLAPVPLSLDFGFARSVLGDTVAAFAIDYVNTVIVSFAAGDTIPPSLTYDAFINGGNAAILGSEIIQFQNIADNGNGTFTLSVLLRGQRGTEWATGSHRNGEFFTLAEVGRMGVGTLPYGEIGVVEYYRLLPTGSLIDSVPSQSFTYLGYDLKPYAPVDFSRLNVGADVQVGWSRRTRIGGDMIDGTDTVPLNEDSEAYEAYLLASPAALATFDPTDAGTYVRAYIGLTAPQLLYTSAQMTTDGFDRTTDSLPVVSYQLSGVVGRGFRGYQLLPAF